MALGWSPLVSYAARKEGSEPSAAWLAVKPPGATYAIPSEGSSTFGAEQAAKAQFGPVRPTLLPSGHTFASCVQACCVGAVGASAAGRSFALRYRKAPMPT